MSQKTIRIGIIGTGNRGITCIGRRIAEQRGELDLDLTAFCDQTESRMQIALDDVNGAASGGALNDKGSHYTDVFNWFAGGKAVQVNAFGGRNVFQVRENAPQFCMEWDWDCAYRADQNRLGTQDQKKGAVDQSFDQETDPLKRKDNCVYKEGADIFDHAAIHYQYDNGIVANIFYTVYGPQAEDEETMELVGTKGRLILTRFNGEIDLVTDYGEKRHEVIPCKAEAFETSHFGADRK